MRRSSLESHLGNNKLLRSSLQHFVRLVGSFEPSPEKGSSTSSCKLAGIPAGTPSLATHTDPSRAQSCAYAIRSTEFKCLCGPLGACRYVCLLFYVVLQQCKLAFAIFKASAPGRPCWSLPIRCIWQAPLGDSVVHCTVHCVAILQIAPFDPPAQAFRGQVQGR